VNKFNYNEIGIFLKYYDSRGSNMKYLENAFKFLVKYYLLAIPLFIAIAIPAIIAGSGSAELAAQIQELQKSMLSDPEMMQDPACLLQLYSTLAPMLAASGIAGAISFILMLIIKPATYGMVNKALETGNADLSDFGPEMKNNFPKYILFGLATAGLYIGIFIAAIIVFAVFAALMAASKAVGIILMVLFSMAFIVFLIAFSILTYLWFPAMVSDNLGVFDGLKKSISVVKGYFWPIIGISLLVGIGSGVAGGIVGAAGNIAVVGPLLTSIVTVAVEFVMIVFAFEVYRDKTGKCDYMDEGTIMDTPGDYL
jgi:hypothetical protein